MHTTESEEQLERRLMREAENVQLGILFHKLARGDGTDDCAKVEITFGYYSDDFGYELEQSAGHYIVHVPVCPPTGDETVDMANHPTALAAETVHEHLADRKYDYLSIDEIRAY